MPLIHNCFSLCYLNALTEICRNVQDSGKVRSQDERGKEGVWIHICLCVFVCIDVQRTRELAISPLSM